jgi:ketosteroid isomerase-like protein
MEHFDAESFARTWIDSWNRRDLAAVLSHYADDVRFVSPTAARVTGNAVVVGKTALESYWTRALARGGDLRFVLEQPIWDAERRVLAIVYGRRAGDGYDAAIEVLHFRPDGLIDRAEAMYGALASRGAPVA